MEHRCAERVHVGRSPDAGVVVEFFGAGVTHGQGGGVGPELRRPLNGGDPEVAQLHLTEHVDEHVLWLDVAVDDADVVGRLQPCGGRRSDERNAGCRDVTGLVGVEHRTPAHELHHDRRPVRGADDLFDLDDVGMSLECDERSDLSTQSPLEEVGVVAVSAIEDLQGDHTTGRCTSGLVHRSEATAGKRSDVGEPVDAQAHRSRPLMSGATSLHRPSPVPPEEHSLRASALTTLQTYEIGDEDVTFLPFTRNCDVVQDRCPDPLPAMARCPGARTSSPADTRR